jgi:hypothetical protein
MQELFNRLIAALAAGGPNSPDVQQVLQQINQQFPGQADVARAIVSGWAGGAAPPAQPPGQPPQTTGVWWKVLVPTLAALGIGTGAGTQLDASGLLKTITSIPLPQVTNRWPMLGIVAALGAVVGVAYSVYRNNWALILPSFARDQNQFKVASWGFLRNLFMGAVVSTLTTWTAFANAPANTNLLTWTVLLSAVAAGVVGSRMASGQVEKDVLWTALAQSADQPPVPGLGRLVDNAKTALDAAAIATGQPVPGVKPPPEMSVVRTPADIEADLLTLFDRPMLKDWLVRRGTPLGNDGAGLTLGTMEQVQPLKSSIKIALNDLEIVRVATMSPDAFLADLDRRGIASASFRELLTNIHGTAIRVKELLSTLPASWSLTADRA